MEWYKTEIKRLGNTLGYYAIIIHINGTKYFLVLFGPSEPVKMSQLSSPASNFYTVVETSNPLS